MNEPLDLARIFLGKADEDQSVVFGILDELLPADSIFGFHAQQVAEKLLKAALAVRGIAFRRTHQIRELMDLAAENGIGLPPSRILGRGPHRGAPRAREDPPGDPALVAGPPTPQNR